MPKDFERSPSFPKLPETTAEKYLERLAEPLRREAGKLKSKGFPVDDNCRVDLQLFSDVVSPSVINKDRATVADLEGISQRRLAEAEDPEEEKIRRANGELLERVKTLSINNLWFEGRLISVRTSKYDDFANGVDNLILDTETNQPLAAIDDTTGFISKIEKLEERKISEGAIVRYGVDYSKGKINKKSYNKLPIFIISANPERVRTLAEDLVMGKMSAEGLRILQDIMNSLFEQSEAFQNKAVDPQLKSSYQRIGKIFGQL